MKITQKKRNKKKKQKVIDIYGEPEQVNQEEKTILGLC